MNARSALAVMARKQGVFQLPGVPVHPTKAAIQYGRFIAID